MTFATLAAVTVMLFALSKRWMIHVDFTLTDYEYSPSRTWLG